MRKWFLTAAAAALLFTAIPSESKAQVAVQIGAPVYGYNPYGYGVVPGAVGYGYAPYYGGTSVSVGTGGFGFSYSTYPSFGYYGGGYYRPYYGGYYRPYYGGYGHGGYGYHHHHR